MKNNINDYNKIGQELYSWAGSLFPICRSITGDGVRKTLEFLKDLMPSLKIYSVPSGTRAFDWVVPNEWNIKDAYIEDEDSRRIVDFKDNNLHIVSYSEPIDTYIDFENLKKHLYSIPEQPKAIPYHTSYYKRDWGFCLSYESYLTMKPGKYYVKIDSSLKPGFLNYGELLIKGKSKNEVLLSTNICHPSMANNEISGPVIAIALAKWINSLKNRRYTYRILFLPETIGSIVYLNKLSDKMIKRTIAGYVITCVGDNNNYSFLPSKEGNTLADRAARNVLRQSNINYKEYSFLDRGSDERQYCSPGIELPVCSIMRSKYGTYPEYHTSLDNLDFISPKGLEGGYSLLRKTLETLEINDTYKAVHSCEPHLSKYNFRSGLGGKNTNKKFVLISNILAYSDGKKDLIELSNIFDTDISNIYSLILDLLNLGLLKKI